MALFGKKKKEQSCCCSGSCNEETMAEVEKTKGSGSRIKILGAGCAKCNDLEVSVQKALEELGRDESIDHVTDFMQIASYGVMTTPALVIDGKVVSIGKVLSVDEVKELIRKQTGGR